MYVRRQSRLLASGWQSLPTDEAGFRKTEPSYDEVQTLCDPGWHIQPMINHNLYTKYLETERLTLTTELKPIFITQHDISQDNTYTLYMAIL